MVASAASLWFMFAVVILQQCRAFQSPRVILPNDLPSSQRLSMSASSDAFNRSRLAGNQREPTTDEIMIMDEMIMKLANAKPYDLPSSVQRAFRVISSPRFFVRIAELTDNTQDETEKEKLISLASNLVSTLDAVVSTAQDKLLEQAKDVESVVKAAAEPDSGEFFVPLLPERRDAMRKALNKLDASSLDGDTFLSTVDAWMNKSHQDGLDLMVGILQNVLQLYAGRRILEARTGTALTSSKQTTSGKLFNELLQTDSERWDITIRQGLTEMNVDVATTAEELISEIQRNMEAILFSLESGSMAQRVQAEYLQELVRRVDTIQKTL
jgi:hypothetical protein